MALITGWGRGYWGEGPWGQPIPVTLTGQEVTTAVGSVFVSTGASIVPDGQEATAAVGSPGVAADAITRGEEAFARLQVALQSREVAARRLGEAHARLAGALSHLETTSDEELARLRGAVMGAVEGASAVHVDSATCEAAESLALRASEAHAKRSAALLELDTQLTRLRETSEATLLAHGCPQLVGAIDRALSASAPAAAVQRAEAALDLALARAALGVASNAAEQALREFGVTGSVPPLNAASTRLSHALKIAQGAAEAAAGAADPSRVGTNGQLLLETSIDIGLVSGRELVTRLTKAIKDQRDAIKRLRAAAEASQCAPCPLACPSPAHRRKLALCNAGVACST